MARHHSITVETIGRIEKVVKKADEKNFNPLLDWEWEIRDDFTDTSVNIIEKPTHVEKIQEFDDHWLIEIEVPISLTKCVISSDEEHKAWRDVDWDDSVIVGDVTVYPNTEKSFEVIDDQSFWVEEEDGDEVDDN